MKTQQEDNMKRWLVRGWVAIALLGASVAQAQVQIDGVKQPRLSPAGCHAVFTNIKIVPQDGKTAVIQFDMEWDTAWRHDVNHSAVWVFFKVRLDGTNEWKPVRLVADKVLNPTGYGQATGKKLDFMVPGGDDGNVGAFVRMADHGMGDVKATGLTVIWDLTASPEIRKDTKVALKVYGLRMVYVADGPFYLGTGGDESYSFYRAQPEKKQAVEKERIGGANATLVVREAVDSAAEFPPYPVTNAAAIPTGKTPGLLWAHGAEPADGGEIPATFPNGYKGFYMMDRPIPQAAFAYFLSWLPPEMAERFMNGDGMQGPGGWFGRIYKTNDGTDNTYAFTHGRLKSYSTWWLSWEVGATFAAWTGLRPMTELEHEKALRGPRYPVVNEAAHSFWGGSYGGGRYNAHPREPQVTVGNETGRKFTGTHGKGDGVWPADWPKKDAVGIGVHGGQECACGVPELKGAWWCTSCRINAATGDPEPNLVYGFRGARTAPEEAKWNSVRNEQESSPLLQGGD